DLVAFLLGSTEIVASKRGRGVHKRREAATLIDVIDVGTEFDQLPHDIGLAVKDRPAQCCDAVAIRRVNRKAALHQPLTFRDISVTSRAVQWPRLRVLPRIEPRANA